MRLPDRLLDIHQRRRRAARICPDEISDQNEIRAGGREFTSLHARGRKADARGLEQLGPPLQALGDRLDRRPLYLRVGLAEQQIIRAGFARGHRIVPCRQAADPGDAVGLQ